MSAGVMMKNMPWKSMCVNRGIAPSIGVAGALASAVAIFLYELVMDGVTGMMGAATDAKPATAAR